MKIPAHKNITHYGPVRSQSQEHNYLDDRQGWIEGSTMLETPIIQGLKDYSIPQSIPDDHLGTNGGSSGR
jgi:hypothetical protein